MKNRVIFLFLIIQSIPGFSQSNFLNRKISLHIPECSLEIALREIGKAGNFRFSYDASLTSGTAKVRVSCQNKQVSSLLKEILGREVLAREVGNHVILLRKKTGQHENKQFTDILVTGKILDAVHLMPLKNATIYETTNKGSALTGENGTFNLLIPSGKNVRCLTICKSGYADTVIFITRGTESRINIVLKPLQEYFSRLKTQSGELEISNSVHIDSLRLVNWLIPKLTLINAQNLEVGSTRTFQASIIPYIGTNWKVTGSITNRFSLNLLAGYTGGLNGFELGVLINITRKETRGLQVGLMGNIVGGKGQGWQIGGLFNYDLGKFDGFQAGGLFNYVPDTLRGVQIGGFANVVTGQIKGVQIAGMTNIATRNNDGWQVAGLVNIARRHNSGVQIAGFLNYATIVDGLQLGIVNVSNSVERGVPVGLFSYVQEGYHLFEISGNEIFYCNAAFKSGTKGFYNFVQLGIGSDYKLQGSYGIGTMFTLKKKLSMNLDASAGFVYHPTDTIYHGLLLKFNPALEFRFAKHFAIFLGPAYNFFLFPKGHPSATTHGLSTYDFYFKSTPNASIQMWIGGVFGIRF